MAGESIDGAVRLWRAEERLLAGLEAIVNRPPAPTQATVADLHNLYEVKDVLEERPLDLDRFAREMAELLALADVSPEEFERARKERP